MRAAIPIALRFCARRRRGLDRAAGLPLSTAQTLARSFYSLELSVFYLSRIFVSVLLLLSCARAVAAAKPADGNPLFISVVAVWHYQPGDSPQFMALIPVELGDQLQLQATCTQIAEPCLVNVYEEWGWVPFMVYALPDGLPDAQNWYETSLPTHAGIMPVWLLVTMPVETCDLKIVQISQTSSGSAAAKALRQPWEGPACGSPSCTRGPPCRVKIKTRRGRNMPLP
jgi:hypothetical protein